LRHGASLQKFWFCILLLVIFQERWSNESRLKTLGSLMAFRQLTDSEKIYD